jgi:hypothetical protein
LNTGYWRYKYNSDEIIECENMPGNCLGGWFAGNPSCLKGNIGCLCESCDLYNIRGDGAFYKGSQF